MSTDSTISPLRQRMIEDMAARKLNPHTQRSHIASCKRFAAFLKRSPDTADSGFCRDDLMSGCEDNNVQYVLGLAGNSNGLRTKRRTGAISCGRQKARMQRPQVSAELG